MPRIRAVLFLLTFIAASWAAPVQAEDLPAPPEAVQGDTRIEADDTADVIRFFVNGKLAAILDETGLHVRESIKYDGTIADSGPDGFSAHAAEVKGQPPHAE